MPHVEGIDDDGAGRGVEGRSDDGSGVVGLSTSGIGVHGGSDTNYGVEGVSTEESGVVGRSDANDKAGVEGRSGPETGVWGHSDSGWGVFGGCTSGPGVEGRSTEESGVFGRSTNGPGVHGVSTNGRAGKFEGDVEVTGDVFLTGADCAEDFDTSGGERIESGTVVVIEDEGSLQPSYRPYDNKVAGVISGASGLKPGLILDRQESREGRVPVALIGKVECKIDAQYGPIEVGDLLTTSPTPGHAMKVDDPLKAFGAVVGKALRPLKSGRGHIPVLIALQ